MENQPSLLDDLTRCLGVNQLAPSSSSTLRALLECGRYMLSYVCMTVVLVDRSQSLLFAGVLVVQHVTI